MDTRYLIKIAKDAILEELEKRAILDREELLKAHPELKRKVATFVTLQKRKSLRGCIGTLVAHQTLYDDLVSNAKLAAFRDSRFRPLKMAEFEDKNFSIEISLLSSPDRVRYRDIDELKKRIKVGVDGVVLKYGTNQATYLPQVWEQLPKFEEFFSSLCHKAGLKTNCLEKKPQIFTYQVKKIEE
jgi:AmmeMemoRadiSam system protein A